MARQGIGSKWLPAPKTMREMEEDLASLAMGSGLPVFQPSASFFPDLSGSPLFPTFPLAVQAAGIKFRFSGFDSQADFRPFPSVVRFCLEPGALLFAQYPPS